MGSGQQTIEYSFWCLCEIKGRYSSRHEQEGERVALALAMAINGVGQKKKEMPIFLREKRQNKNSGKDKTGSMSWCVIYCSRNFDFVFFG
jgi:hypothetical protein